MFDPIFDVNWFHTQLMPVLVLGATLLAFVGGFLWSVFDFVEDEFEVNDATVKTLVIPFFTLCILWISLFVGSVIISYLWFPLSIIAIMCIIAYVARGVRRLQKDLNKHKKDKNAHKGG